MLAGDSFIPESYLRQPGFTYSSCGLLTKHRGRYTNLEKHDLKHIFKSKVDEACFAYDAAYSDSKDLAKRSISDKF